MACSSRVVLPQRSYISVGLVFGGQVTTDPARHIPATSKNVRRMRTSFFLFVFRSPREWARVYSGWRSESSFSREMHADALRRLSSFHKHHLSEVIFEAGDACQKDCCDCFRKSLIPWTPVAYLSLGQNDIISALEGYGGRPTRRTRSAKRGSARRLVIASS